MRGWQNCQYGLQWQVTKGTHVLFWTDNWIAPNTNIRSLIQGPLHNHEAQLTVAKALHLNYGTQTTLL